MKQKQEKATGFKSQRKKLREINQVASKHQMGFWNKTCRKRSKTGKKNITINFHAFQVVHLCI